MPSHPIDQVLSPPELPPYLSAICKLSSIVGCSTDEQIIEIHTTIRVANRVVDYMGDSLLLATLSEHLFNAQMARYRSKYSCSIFATNTTYTPPTLPSHIPVKLEAVSGQPSQEEIIKVQSAIRTYQKLADIPSLFDPKVNAELGQHLFDIQMALYMERCNHAGPAPQNNTLVELTSATHPVEPANQDVDTSTNNAGRVSDAEATQASLDLTIRDALERSNQLAERSNQLIERSNQIAEQLTRVVEQSNQPQEQSNTIAEKVTNLFERMDQHFEQSNRLAEASVKQVEKLGDILKNINKILVGIQHAIVRSRKGNTLSTLDCLVNEKGNSHLQNTVTFSSLSELYSHESKYHLPLLVGGITQNCYIPDHWLGTCLHFFGIGSDFLENEESIFLIQGYEEAARKLLSRYLSSCFN